MDIYEIIFIFPEKIYSVGKTLSFQMIHMQYAKGSAGFLSIGDIADGIGTNVAL